jgi:integrase
MPRRSRRRGTHRQRSHALSGPARASRRATLGRQRAALSDPRATLGRLLTEIPPAHQPLYVLLASTGLRIPEAIALRWCDLDLEASPPRLQVRRAIVRGVVGAPKSYYGARAIPLAEELAGRLRALRPPDAEDEDLVFPNRRGRPLNPNNLRNRVLAPAAKRTGVSGVGLHALRHTCASLLIEERTSSLRLQRWMGHHAAAYTLEAYGHLIDGDLGRVLELEDLGVRDCER